MAMAKETNSPESIKEPTNHKDFLTAGIGASGGGSHQHSGFGRSKGKPQSAIEFVLDTTERRSQEEDQANIDNKAGENLAKLI